MEKIKKGDVLVCIDADQVTLTKGYHYEAASDSTCKDLVRVKCDLGTETNYCVSRFRKADSYNGIPQLTAPLDLIKQIAEANPAFKAEAEKIWPDTFPVPEIKLKQAPIEGYENDVVIADVIHPIGTWAVSFMHGRIILNCDAFDWKIEGDKLIPTRKP